MLLKVNLPQPIRIGPLAVPGNAFLAPMSGVSDLPFRRLCARFGASLVVSEMVAGEAVASGSQEAVLRASGEGLDCHIVQLTGREEGAMAFGVKVAEAAGADVIDINMGCPSRRVTQGYSGSALMRDLDHALRLIDATVAAASVPVTLKMRLGWDENAMNAPELAKRAQDAGIRMVTVHGRTRRQFFKGQANWNAIQTVKDAVSIPVVANGDLTAPEMAAEMLHQSGADAVMIGRGAYGKPWIIGQTAALLATRWPRRSRRSCWRAIARSCARTLRHDPDPLRNGARRPDRQKTSGLVSGRASFRGSGLRPAETGDVGNRPGHCIGNRAAHL